MPVHIQDYDTTTPQGRRGKTKQAMRNLHIPESERTLFKPSRLKGNRGLYHSFMRVL